MKTVKLQEGKDNVWSSCLNPPVTLGVKSEIPQYLNIFTFHHSLRFLFVPVISFFQSTFITKLTMDTPRHIIVSSFIFCLRQLTALTHHMAHRFSLISAHSAQRGFCCAISVKSHIICSQSLFLGCYISGPQYILSNLPLQSTATFYPSQYLPFSLTYCPCIFFASIHSPSPLLYSLYTPLGPQPLRCRLRCYLQFSLVIPLHYYSHTNSNCSLLSSHSSHN